MKKNTLIRVVAMNRFLLVFHQRGCSYQIRHPKQAPLAPAAMERVLSNLLLHHEQARPATKIGGRESGGHLQMRMGAFFPTLVALKLLQDPTLRKTSL